MKKNECDVVFLLPGFSFSQRFLESWTNTIIYCYENNIKFVYKIYYSPLVTQTRNSLIGTNPFGSSPDGFHPIKAFDNKLKAKQVVFIDDDMVWNTEALDKLLKSPYDITVAPYILSNFKNSSIQISADSPMLPIEELKKYKEPFEIEGSGMGFMACKGKVLETIEYPWFQTYAITTDVDKSKLGETLGEDIFFFAKAKHNGFKAYCDPTIKVGHEKTRVYTLD